MKKRFQRPWHVPDDGGVRSYNGVVGDVVYCECPHASGHVVNADGPLKLPEGCDPRVGVFIANLKTTFIGMLDAGVRLNECVVVFGQGTLGQFITQWAKLSGAGPVVAVDLNDKRLRLSKEVSGADVTLNPKTTEDIALAVREITGNRGADVAIEVSASDRALNEAIRTVCYCGRVIVLSWYPGALANVFPGNEFHMNRVQLICSQTCGIGPVLSNRWSEPRVLQTVLEHLPTLNLEPLISHEIDIDDAAKAYKMIDEGQKDVMQIILKY
jgi:threonine dehydrogenase-like Zn-dependent dehydrogenase